MRHLSLFWILLVLPAGSTFSQDRSLPQINFDVPAVIGCREVTTEEFANTHSLEKLLEVRLNASSLLANGTDRCIRELFFLIYSPERSFQVVDFSPQTTLITEFAAPIDETSNKENVNSAGFNFSPNLELAGKASLNANLSDKEGKSLRTSRLPPKQLAVASGTQRRGTAVYFKMKPSSQLTLEGTHEIVITLKVPIAWRADLMHVHCRGLTAWSESGPSRKSRADFVVPIHLSSDAPAKILCEELVREEGRVRARAVALDKKPQQQKKKDFVSRVNLFVKREVLGKKDRQVNSTSWLGALIFTTKSTQQIISESSIDFDAETTRTMKRYRVAREKVFELNG